MVYKLIIATGIVPGGDFDPACSYSFRVPRSISRRRGLILLLQVRDAEAGKDFEECRRLAPELMPYVENRIEEIKRKAP